VPRGWEDAFGLIAGVFRTQPSELWAMDADGWELKLWLEQAVKEAERRRG
jgi:hypothetical protein